MRISSASASSSARSTTHPPKPATVVPAGIAGDREDAHPLRAGRAASGERAEPRLAHGHLRVSERSPAEPRDGAVRIGQNTGVSKRQERERLVRRRVASTRRDDEHRRPPVRAGRLSPRRSVPADDPPAAVRARRARRSCPRCRPTRSPTACAPPAAPRARCCSRSAPRCASASPPTSSTASATRRTSPAAATRAPLDYKGYPKSLCTSVNEVICHGIPDDRALARRRHRELRRHDLPARRARRLQRDLPRRRRRRRRPPARAGRRTSRCGRASTRCGPGGRINEIGRAIQTHAEADGSASCASFVGHGVGETFHTAPSVPHFYDPHADTRDRAGHDVHDRADDQRRRVGARPHLARRLDRADARRLALGAVRAQPARDRRPASRCSRSSPAKPASPPARHASRTLAGSVGSCDWRARRRVVTGSTSGLGRAIAVAFAREGAAVVVTGRDQARGDAVVAEITARRRHRVASSRPTSATKRRARSSSTTAAERLGGLTVLVNNAAGGDAADGPVADLTTEAWDAILRVDLTAPMWCARAAIPHMQRAGHGSIVNISSRQAERASRGLRRVRRGQGRAERAHARDRGRLRGRRHPLQHDQPRLRAQRPPRRRHHARAPRALRRHAPHPARRRRRRRLRGACTSRAASRSSSPASTCSSTAAAASPAASRSADRDAPARVRERDLHVQRSRSPTTSRSGQRHGIDTVGVSVAKLEAFGWEAGTELVADAVGRGLRVVDLIGLGPFHLADPASWDAAAATGSCARSRPRPRSAPSASCSRPGRSRRSRGRRRPTRSRPRSRRCSREAARRAASTFAIEHTNSLRVDVGFVHTLRDAIDLARRLDVGVCMELNACWAERGLAATIRDGIDRIRLVQVSDFKVGTVASSQRLVPGDGDIPIERILGVAARRGLRAASSSSS